MFSIKMCVFFIIVLMLFVVNAAHICDQLIFAIVICFISSSPADTLKAEHRLQSCCVVDSGLTII